MSILKMWVFNFDAKSSFGYIISINSKALFCSFKNSYLITLFLLVYLCKAKSNLKEIILSSLNLILIL